MNIPISPGSHSRRPHMPSRPPNRSEQLRPSDLQSAHIAAAHAADHRMQQPPKGHINMLDRSQIDATVFRVAVAAFTYYPEKANHEPGYTLEEDLDWCMRPLRHLPEESLRELRERITTLVTDPTADRQAFIRRLQREGSDLDHD